MKIWHFELGRKADSSVRIKIKDLPKISAEIMPDDLCFFHNSQSFEDLPVREEFQSKFMLARPHLEWSFCDAFVDRKRKNQGSLPNFGTAVLRGSFLKKNLGRLDFKALSVKSKFQRQDLPLVTAKKCTLKIDASFPHYFYIPNYKKTTGSLKGLLKKRLRLDAIIFLPCPGNGGADSSNLRILAKQGLNLRRCMVVFTFRSAEMSKLQIQEFESNFGLVAYLQDSHFVHFSLMAWTKFAKKSNIRKFFFYASDFGAQLVAELKKTQYEFVAAVILHNRLVGGWLGHAIRYKASISKFIVISESCRDHLICYGVGSEKIEVEYLDDVLDLKPRRRLRSPDRLVLGYVGRLSHEKGMRRLVAIALLLKNKALDFRIMVVGTGPEAPWFLNEIGSHKLEKNFEFCGHQKEAQMKYGQLSGLLIVSDIEGIPIVLMEAQHAGVPVFSTPVGEVPEYKSKRNLHDGLLRMSTSFDEDDVAKEAYSWILTSIKPKLLLAKSIFKIKNGLEIPYFAGIVHRHRAFDHSMDLDRPESRNRFAYWWLAFGVKEYGLSESLLSARAYARLKKSLRAFEGPLCWSLLAELAFEYEPFLLRTQAPQPTLENMDAATRWFYSASLPRRDMLWMLNRKELDFLKQKIFVFDSEDYPIERFAFYGWQNDPSLQEAFDLQTQSGRSNYVAWIHTHGLSRDGWSNFYREQSASAQLISQIQSKTPLNIATGVNIIGLKNSISGVGEDSRMLSLSLKSQGIANAVFDYRGKETLDSVFNISIFCLTAFQFLQSAASLAYPLFKNAYRIGYFPWELPDWPKELKPALEMCDEIWCATSYIAASISNVTKKKVSVMPMAVTVPEEFLSVDQLEMRAESETVRYFFLFDFISGAFRKDVRSCVQAFKLAFKNNENVELKIKTLNFNAESEDGKLFLAEIAGDHRITYFDGKMSRQELTTMMQQSDVFLSLHRAEGFGRGLAEALLMGKQLVCTNFSGNVDFCRPEFSELVDYTLVPVDSKEYVFSKGQVWAQVNLEDAVAKIRKCYERANAGDRINVAGHKFVSSNLCPSAVGQKYACRLRELNLLGDL